MKNEHARLLLTFCGGFNALWAIILGYYSFKLEGPAAAGLAMFVLLFFGGAVLSFYRARRLRA